MGTQPFLSAVNTKISYCITYRCSKGQAKVLIWEKARRFYVGQSQQQNLESWTYPAHIKLQHSNCNDEVFSVHNFTKQNKLCQLYPRNTSVVPIWRHIGSQGLLQPCYQAFGLLFFPTRALSRHQSGPGWVWWGRYNDTLQVLDLFNLYQRITLQECLVLKNTRDRIVPILSRFSRLDTAVALRVVLVWALGCS